jgi:nucleoid-associated protein YgaU
MPSRYSFTPRVGGGSAVGTVSTSSKILDAVQKGKIGFTSVVLKKGQRLDHVSAASYGSSSYWWVIAAASGIGWGLQLPPGTVVRVPNNLGKVLAYIR